MPPATVPRLVLPLSLASAHDGASAFLCLADGGGLGASEAAQGELSDEEARVWRGMAHPRRAESYLAGRWAAKGALGALSGCDDPRAFSIRSGVFTQPVVAGPAVNLQVTISHSGPLALAAAFPESHPLGLDLEPVRPGLAETLGDQFSPKEVQPWLENGWSRDQALALVWTAKEALGKALRTGLTTPLPVYAFSECRFQGQRATSLFENFPQYHVETLLAGTWAWSLCHPQQVRPQLDWAALADWLRARG